MHAHTHTHVCTSTRFFLSFFLRSSRSKPSPSLSSSHSPLSVSLVPIPWPLDLSRARSRHVGVTSLIRSNRPLLSADLVNNLLSLPLITAAPRRRSNASARERKRASLSPLLLLPLLVAVGRVSHDIAVQLSETLLTIIGWDIDRIDGRTIHR